MYFYIYTFYRCKNTPGSWTERLNIVKKQFSQNWSIISVQFQELKKPNGVDNPEIILLQMKIKVIYKI